MNLNYTLGLILLIILLLFFLAGQDESQAACNCPPGWSSGLERICGPKKCFCGGKGKYPGCAPAGAEVDPAAPPVKPSRQPGCSPLAVEEAAAKAAAPHGGDQGRGRCRILPDEATVGIEVNTRSLLIIYACSTYGKYELLSKKNHHLKAQKYCNQPHTYLFSL